MTAPVEPWRRTTDGVVVVRRLTPRGGRDAIDGIAELGDRRWRSQRGCGARR
jgi:hypothetical protein